MGHTLILLAAVPLALFGLHLRSKMSPRQRSAWIGALVVAIALSAAHLGAIALDNVRTVPEWDFLGFWLNAHVAAAHQNVYDPSFARALVQPFTISEEFRREIIDVGFWYPPPSIFVFLPLAAFANLHLAYAIWYLIQAAALVAAMVVLAQVFLRDDGAEGVLAVAVLTLALPAAATTVMYGQTNFLLLLGIALFWRAKDRLTGGAWLGAAVLIKPFVATLGLALLLRRRLAPIGGALATLVVATVAAAALFGVATLKAYWYAGPIQKLPTWVYSESGTQSLLGLLVRAAGNGYLAAWAVRPLSLILSALLVAATLYLCVRAPSGHQLAFCLALLLGLLAYPVTGQSYGVVLIVPMLVLWTMRNELPWSFLGVSVIIGLAILLQGHFRAGFAANALLWACCAYATIAAQPASRRQPADLSLERPGLA